MRFRAWSPQSVRLLKKAKLPSSMLIKVLALISGAIIASVALASVLPQRSDWSDVYRPAALALLAGKSPYVVDNYVAPPWVLIPLLPLAVLPERIGRIAIFWLSIAGFAYLARRNAARLWSIVALIVSYPVIYGLIYGQIDWLMMGGLILPPWLGLLLLMAKPQIGIGVAMFLGFEAWTSGGIRRLVSVFLPLTCLVLVSYLIFGPEFFTKSRLVLSPTNTSLWPRSIPIGLVILVASIRQKRKFLSLASSPFFSPYMPVHSWAAVIVGLSDDALYPVLISAASWLVWGLGGGAVNG
jgi:hypothetical protein